MVKLEVIDVAKTASASTIIFEALRKAIVSGDLKDGEPLRQEEIARLFNSSRIPVREAITRLEQSGLVKNVRFKGAVVAGISDKDLDEIFDLRMLLEGAIIRYAVPLMTEETFENARQRNEIFLSSSDTDDWAELNRNFHCSLYEAADRPNHMAVIDSIMDRIDRYLRAQLSFHEGLTEAGEEHEAILQACIDRDVDLAGRLTETHVLESKQALLDFFHQQRAAQGNI